MYRAIKECAQKCDGVDLAFILSQRGRFMQHAMMVDQLGQTFGADDTTKSEAEFRLPNLSVPRLRLGPRLTVAYYELIRPIEKGVWARSTLLATIGIFFGCQAMVKRPIFRIEELPILRL